MCISLSRYGEEKDKRSNDNERCKTTGDKPSRGFTHEAKRYSCHGLKSKNSTSF
ncbi:Hypothetical protein BFF96_1845 [Corynebacterium pseudotuberculosis]|nr:Hypothetical protein BFF96_1845 [Corynebacterium pseudotuberculosis]